MNIIQYQNGNVIFDNERKNGSTYYYNKSSLECSVIEMGVGILRPDWLSDAVDLGEEDVDNFRCQKVSKGDGEHEPFITYWYSVDSELPIKWIFFDGGEFHVMKFTEGETLSESDWQIPEYCFTMTEPRHHITSFNPQELSLSKILARGIAKVKQA
uniref:Uncharacterized protein n=1 Tax=Fibrocapsa japonica TaxID=94617 RepID=A0A7S2UWX4_9STRA